MSLTGGTIINKYNQSAICEGPSTVVKVPSSCSAVDFNRLVAADNSSFNQPSPQPTSYPTILTNDDYYISNFHHDALEQNKCWVVVGANRFPTVQPSPGPPTLNPTSHFPSRSPTTFEHNVITFIATVTFLQLPRAIPLDDIVLRESFEIATCTAMNLTMPHCECDDNCLSLSNSTIAASTNALNSRKLTSTEKDLTAQVVVMVNLVDYPSFRSAAGEAALYSELQQKLNASVSSGKWLFHFHDLVADMEVSDYGTWLILQDVLIENYEVGLSSMAYRVAFTSAPTLSPTPSPDEGDSLPTSIVIGITLGVAAIVILFFFTSHYCAYGCFRKDVPVYPSSAIEP